MRKSLFSKIFLMQVLVAIVSIFLIIPMIFVFMGDYFLASQRGDILKETKRIAALSEKYEGAEVAVQRLGERVKEHVGEAEASDDLTMLCLEWKG